uniref:Uncharacterized protein n=1 Tax=Arundo donax TaxID=35708 RepID=A0A0A9BWH5_ARUDO
MSTSALQQELAASNPAARGDSPAARGCRREGRAHSPSSEELIFLGPWMQRSRAASADWRQTTAHRRRQAIAHRRRQATALPEWLTASWGDWVSPGQQAICC